MKYWATKAQKIFKKDYNADDGQLYKVQFCDSTKDAALKPVSYLKIMRHRLAWRTFVDCIFVTLLPHPTEIEQEHSIIGTQCYHILNLWTVLPGRGT